MIILPVHPEFIAEVGDVDLSRRLPEEEIEQIKEAFWRHAVLVFPDQRLTVEQHLDFARQFGPLESTIFKHRPGTRLRVPAEIADVSNLDHQQQVWAADSDRRRHEMGNRLWHTDSSFRAVRALASLLYARSIPPVGGHTQFADLRAACDALPADRRQQLAGLRAEHCLRYSRARIGFTDFSEQEREALPPVLQPLLSRIPQTGRLTLYLASHAGRIEGWDDATGAELIDELIDHATQPQFVHTHRWRENDLVIWDNRCTMHRGTEFDDTRWPRDVQRATVSDLTADDQR